MTIVANRPFKSARPRVWGGRALSWWLGELAGCWHDFRRFAAMRLWRCPTIETGERYWLLRQGDRPIGQIDTEAGDYAPLQRLAEAGRRRSVLVTIPAERTLAKTIALPAGAQGQLDRILEFEIARHFPFPAERVYFAHRVVRGGGTAAVTVQIVAVPREIVDGLCLSLAAARLKPAAVLVGGGHEGEALSLPAAALATARRGIPASTRWLVFAAAFALAAALVSWPVAQWTQLGALEREITTLKPTAEASFRAGESERRAVERGAAIVALRAGRPPLVAVLDALSRAVPDGAWLLSLSVAGREVVLDGLAPSAAGVALALEKTRDLSGIVFRSPITREASGLEHFQLGATLSAPGSESKP
jgi:general secretion pathway protein L